MRYLLDTNIISEPVKQRPHTQVVDRLRELGDELAIASIVWHELQFGLRRMPEGRKRETLSHYLHQVIRAALPIIPYDDAAAEWHGRERARLEASGIGISFADGMIAGIAVTRNLVLVTRNREHFRHFGDLIVENWFDS